MAKIMIFNSYYSPHVLGGAERSVQMLAESLLEAGEHIVVVNTSDVDSARIVNNVKVYDVRIPNLYWGWHSKKQTLLKKIVWHLIDSCNVFGGKKIRQIIKRERPDVIHTNNITGFSPYVFRVAKMENIPVVHTIRDYYFLCSRSSMFKKGTNCENQCIACKFYSRPKKRLSQNVDIVVGVSNFILQKHLKHGFFGNAKTQRRVFNIYDPSTRFTKTIQSTNGTRFAFVGILGPVKGIDYAIESFLKANRSQDSLHIYGKGQTIEYEEHLRKAYLSDRVRFHGFKNPEDIYPHIDVLIIPSLWHEPFPRTLIEAFSCGIPVLASNKGGIPEIIHDGENGFLFDPDKEDDLSNLIERVSSRKEDLTRIQRNASHTALEFTKNAIVSQYVDIYTSALQTKRKKGP